MCYAHLVVRFHISKYDVKHLRILRKSEPASRWYHRTCARSFSREQSQTLWVIGIARGGKLGPNARLLFASLHTFRGPTSPITLGEPVRVPRLIETVTSWSYCRQKDS